MWSRRGVRGKPSGQEGPFWASCERVHKLVLQGATIDLDEDFTRTERNQEEASVVAFISSLLVLALLVGAVFPYAKRRPVGTPLTWGEAMVGAVYVFFIMFWVYGIVPHQWLQWADAELQWSPSRIWLGPGVSGDMVIPLAHWHISADARNWFPVNIHAEVLRDVIATLLYVVALGFNIWIWAWWQNRGTRSAAAPKPTSQFGRPLVKRA